RTTPPPAVTASRLTGVPNATPQAAPAAWTPRSDSPARLRSRAPPDAPTSPRPRPPRRSPRARARARRAGRHARTRARDDRAPFPDQAAACLHEIRPGKLQGGVLLLRCVVKGPLDC